MDAISRAGCPREGNVTARKSNVTQLEDTKQSSKVFGRFVVCVGQLRMVFS
jgi:hypothetical protein